MLFREFPQHNEGQKSKLKASLVSAASLARLGERIGLGEYLILGRGEEKTGGRKKQALLADGYEALIAAIYLDGGIEPARAFIERQFEELIDEARRTGARGGVHRGLQVRAAGMAAVAPGFACPRSSRNESLSSACARSTRGSRHSSGSSASRSTRSAISTGAGWSRSSTEALERVAGGSFVHVSVDMDVVDPEVAPGVGDPVRGGLSYREVHLALELVAEAGVLDALDLVEVNPIHDHENTTAGVAVELAASAFGLKIL